MTPGITREKEGLDGTVWNILGQTYVPKLRSDDAFVWYAELPAGTFVPPHVHPTQDEWVSVLKGTLEVDFAAGTQKAEPGDLIRLPRGESHGLFNRGEETVEAIFGVAPARSLPDLFEKISGLDDPAEVVRLAAEHEVEFLPPPEG